MLWNFQGSFFLALEFPRDPTQFCGISRGWELFCLEFPIHQPISTRENGEHPGNFQNKSVISALNWVPPFYFLKWNPYFSACKRKFLESTSQFSFKFCINLQCFTFFNSNILYFGQKQPIKVYIFETFEFSSQNSSNSLC